MTRLSGADDEKVPFNLPLSDIPSSIVARRPFSLPSKVIRLRWRVIVCPCPVNVPLPAALPARVKQLSGQKTQPDVTVAASRDLHILQIGIGSGQVYAGPLRPDLAAHGIQGKINGDFDTLRCPAVRTRGDREIFPALTANAVGAARFHGPLLSLPARRLISPRQRPSLYPADSARRASLPADRRRCVHGVTRQCPIRRKSHVIQCIMVKDHITHKCVDMQGVTRALIKPDIQIGDCDPGSSIGKLAPCAGECAAEMPVAPAHPTLSMEQAGRSRNQTRKVIDLCSQGEPLV